MDIPLDEVVYFDAVASAASGAAADADSTPSFEVFEEGTDTDIGVGGNFTKRTSKTGDYRCTFTLSAANGFEVGKFYSVVGSATIGGVAAKAVIAKFRVCAAEVTTGKAPATIAAGDIATDAITATSVKADAVTKIQSGLATPTNITAGTITTATNLTNLPSIPNNWLTAAGINSGAFTSAKFAAGAFDAVWTVSARSLTTFGTLITDIYTYFTSSSRQDTFKADVSGLATATSVSTLTTYVDTEVAAIKLVTDVLATMIEDVGGYRFNDHALSEAPTGGGGGGGDDAATIYAYFTALNREDVFKADVSALATSTEISNLQTHGDAEWKTATGFTVPGDEMTLTAAYDATKTAAQAGDAMTLTTNERTAVADATLTRSAANVENTAGQHSLCYVILASSEASLSGGNLVVKKTNGTDTFATKPVTTDPAAEPITGIS